MTEKLEKTFQELAEQTAYMKRWEKLAKKLLELRQVASIAGVQIDSIHLASFWRNEDDPTEQFPEKLMGMKILNDH